MNNDEQRMASRTAWDVLNDYADRWRERLLQVCKGHEQESVIELVRALDYLAVRHLFAEDSDDDSQLLATCALNGVATVLRALLPRLRQYGDGIPWRATTDRHQAWAVQTLLQAGELARSRRLAALERSGLTRCTVSQDAIDIEIVAADLEQQDRDDLAWWMRTKALSDRRTSLLDDQEVVRRLKAGVQADPTYFIKYDFGEEVWTHYKHLARTYGAATVERGELPSTARLGPLPFEKWMELADFALGGVLQHFAAATHLYRKEPATDLRNVLTIFVRKEDVPEIWAQRLGDSAHDAGAETSQVAILTAEIAAEYDENYEAPCPYMIEFGNHFVLLPLYGGLVNPYAFMLRNLRTQYRADWDKAVNDREHLFRNDLRALFPEPRFVVSETGNTIRDSSDRILTDVDATVFDRTTGSLLLAQLKWHDVFGSSVRERESRRKNLVQANLWVNNVTQWLGTKPGDAVLQALSIRGKGLNKVVLAVIARNASRFSGETGRSADAVWCTFPSVVRFVRESPSTCDVMAELAAHFGQNDGPWESEPLPPRHYKFDDLTVSVRSADSTANLPTANRGRDG
jgi:hypothetical protein